MKLTFLRPDIMHRNVWTLCMIALTTLLSPSFALAEEIPDDNTIYFAVTESDNTQVLFPVVDKPVITLNETTVTVSSDSKTYSAEIADIMSFIFIGNSLNGVEAITNFNKGIEYSGKSIIVKGLKSGETVSLFDMAGVAVLNFMATDDILMVDLNQVPAGVYILSTKNANYKIRK